MMTDKQRLPAVDAREFAPDAPLDLALLTGQLLDRDPTRRPTTAALLMRGSGASGPPRDAAVEGARVAHERAVALYGREEELQHLHAAFAATLTGVSVLVSVVGASGAGKSALCEAFLGQLRARRAAVVLAGRCFEQESVPFKAIDPLVDELSRYLRGLSDVDAAALLPRDAFALIRLFPVLARVDVIARAPARRLADGPTLRRHALLAFAELLARLRDRAPLVLHIDDFSGQTAIQSRFCASCSRNAKHHRCCSC